MKLRNKKTGKVEKEKRKMSKYEGLYTFDVDNHRYIPVGQADGIIDCFKFKHESKEPLIKDEKIRKAIKLLFDIWGVDQVKIESNKYFLTTTIEGIGNGFKLEIPNININGVFTIAELCGEEEE